MENDRQPKVLGDSLARSMARKASRELEAKLGEAAATLQYTGRERRNSAYRRLNALVDDIFRQEVIAKWEKGSKKHRSTSYIVLWPFDGTGARVIKEVSVSFKTSVAELQKDDGPPVIISEHAMQRLLQSRIDKAEINAAIYWQHQGIYRYFVEMDLFLKKNLIEINIEIYTLGGLGIWTASYDSSGLVCTRTMKTFIGADVLDRRKLANWEAFVKAAREAWDAGTIFLENKLYRGITVSQQ